MLERERPVRVSTAGKRMIWCCAILSPFQLIAIRTAINQGIGRRFFLLRGLRKFNLAEMKGAALYAAALPNFPGTMFCPVASASI
jgi:hypothetical protein